MKNNIIVVNGVKYSVKVVSGLLIQNNGSLVLDNTKPLLFGRVSLTYIGSYTELVRLINTKLTNTPTVKIFKVQSGSIQGDVGGLESNFDYLFDSIPIITGVDAYFNGLKLTELKEQ
jgi:hypothetical protein